MHWIQVKLHSLASFSRRAFLLSTFVALLCCRHIPAAEQASAVKPTISDYAYGSDSPSQRFDFWQAKSEKPTPVVVMIHGGGWINGDKNSYKAGDVRPFLNAGISAASINYRLIAEAMRQGVEPPVKAALYDAARAVQTIRSKAREWNIDPT